MTTRTAARQCFTEEQYRFARESSALEYAIARGYPLIRKGNYYQLRDHDSMVFTQDGFWFWNSRSLKGRAIEFIRAYEDKTLVEAVQILNHAEGQTYADVRSGVQPRAPAPPPPAAMSQPMRAEIMKKPFVLPPQSPDFRRLFGYLCGTRKLDSEILRDLIRQGRIYESIRRYTVQETGELKEVHNAVFVGLDAHGEPKSAFQRGLVSLSSSTAYKRDVPGSDPSSAFCVPGYGDARTVIVFEASIDAISHACVYKDAGLDYKIYDRIALGGTQKAVGLTAYLESHPNITHVVLAMDEDAAGRAADAKIRSQLPEEYEVLSLRQSLGKDWNEYLVRWRELAEHVGQLPTTCRHTSCAQQNTTAPVGRIHYLDDKGGVMETVAYGDRAAFRKQVRLELNSGQRIIAETPEQQARIQQARAARTPRQSEPPQTEAEREDEMEELS